jgi:glycoprotein-N-acetylgalactosamine 3-beta-galactosyltransferase
MIFTTPDNWASKGRAVRLTWSKRCPVPIFFYSGLNVSEQHEIRLAHNTVALDVPEGRGWLTTKTLAGLRYSLDKYGEVAEWFMKADDDT